MVLDAVALSVLQFAVVVATAVVEDLAAVDQIAQEDIVAVVDLLPEPEFLAAVVEALAVDF